MSETKVGWVEKLYGATKETIETLKKPTVIKSMKRKFESAYDDATNQIVDCEAKIASSREKMKELDLNEIIQATMDIKTLKEQQDILKAEYLEAFSEEMKVS